jgi:hypothetical protein
MKSGPLLWALIGLLIAASSEYAQSTDRLTESEISAAIAAKPGIGYAYIEDVRVVKFCEAQASALFIYTPAGWLNARSISARKQYIPFRPEEIETLRALTIFASGCARVERMINGPTCESITRVSLLSDSTGSTVIESFANGPTEKTWQNQFGAAVTCSNMLSRFSMADVQRVRNKKGEFMVATFNGTQLIKLYTVKEKHLKQLGM